MILAFLAVILTVAGGLVATLWQMHARADTLARQRATLLARLVAEDAAATFRQADAAVRDIAGGLSASDLQGALDRDPARRREVVALLRSRQALVPGGVALTLVGADGRVLADSRQTGAADAPPGAPPGAGEPQRAAGDVRVADSPLIARREVDGAPVFTVSRRLSGANGAPLGAVTAAVGVEAHFGAYWKSLPLEPGMSAALVDRRNGDVSAGYLAPSSDSADTADAAARALTLQPLAGSPFDAAVGMPANAGTADWRRLTVQALLAVVVLIATGTMLAYRMDRQAALTRRLQHSEESLRRAQAVAAIGSWEFDATTQRVTWSEEEYRIHGVPLGSPVNYQTVLDLVHPQDRDRLDAAWRAAAVPDGDVYDVVHRIVVDGKLKWVRALAQMHFDDSGRVVHMIGTTQDITDRKRDEDELKRHRDHLEELVEQRTRELSAANQRLQVANAAKSAFLARMSHELRTPLNGILGFAQILKRDERLTEVQHTGLDTIHKSGEHLLALITDLLDFSKIEAGKLELYVSAVELAPFISVVAEIIRAQAEPKGLAFLCEVSGDVPHAVMMDEKRVRQILLNLLGNAIKFTSAGHVAFRLASTASAPGRACLHFEVSDTGVGIASEQLDRIFLPFEQAGALQARHGGTGLGLSISRQLACMMGSDIQVSSEPGRGSCFSFDLEVDMAAGGVAPRYAPPRLG